MLASRTSLVQEVDKLKTKEMEARRDAERELRQRDISIAGLERAVEELNTELTEAKQQVGGRMDSVLTKKILKPPKIKTGRD